MAAWRVAGVQMDCRLGDRDANLAAVRERIAEAADQGAKLVVFPECVVSGYSYSSREQARRDAEPLPGPSTEAVAAECARRGVWAAFGLLESAGEGLFNTCALVGPTGYLGSYRKLHLPCLGVDRFTDPGNRPFHVFDLGGIKLGIIICFDGGFPEAVRVLALLGADLVLWPTNWPNAAFKNATLVTRVRAFENHVYVLAANRVGTEGGYQFCGHSSVVDCNGEFLALADHDHEAIVFADVDPEVARRKKIVYCAGEYEIDRINWRRPEMYGPLVEGARFQGHFLR